MLADKLEAFDNIQRSPTQWTQETHAMAVGTRSDIKSRCPTCNLNASQRTDVTTNHINAYTAQDQKPSIDPLIGITFSG
ncbi:hypothetical protein TNCV_3567671 [Trichonephila clavipes]|nr:hypothetical protein TNCV_3567671 [Trichonephila clavipes]